MSNRVVKKNLIGQEDILYGEGTENQDRNGGTYLMNKVRVIQPVNSIAERDALDVTKFVKCRVYYAGARPAEDYEYTGAAWVLLGATGPNIIVVDSTTTRTLTNNDMGKIIQFSAATAVSVVIPAGLVDGFHTQLLQTGAGQVTVVAGAGAVLQSADALLATRVQYSIMSVQSYATDIFVVAGDLA